jgi:hypothetical protein
MRQPWACCTELCIEIGFEHTDDSHLYKQAVEAYHPVYGVRP